MSKQLGLQLAERGIAKTIAAESDRWQETALRYLREFASSHKTFTAEQFRVWWLIGGNPEPHSHKVWGALFRIAEKDGVIHATGQYKRAASPKTHGHPVMIWKVDRAA